MSPLWTLVPLSLLAGGVLMWAFRRMADVAGIGRAAARIQAHLLEFWLFVDEPSLVWKSWRGLLGANARFLRLLLVPLVVLSIPMVPAWFVLDALYGNAPLVVNQPALVTAGVGAPGIAAAGRHFRREPAAARVQRAASELAYPPPEGSVRHPAVLARWGKRREERRRRYGCPVPVAKAQPVADGVPPLSSGGAARRGTGGVDRSVLSRRFHPCVWLRSPLVHLVPALLPARRRRFS